MVLMHDKQSLHMIDGTMQAFFMIAFCGNETVCGSGQNDLSMCKQRNRPIAEPPYRIRCRWQGLSIVEQKDGFLRY